MHIDSNKKTATIRDKANRPIDYSSTAVRLRLMSLVAALGLVLVAMNEARKPETWEKFGFGSSNLSVAPDSRGAALANPTRTGTDSQKSETNPSHWLAKQFNRLDANELTAINDLIESGEPNLKTDTSVLSRAISLLGRHIDDEDSSDVDKGIRDVIDKILNYSKVKKVELTPEQKRLASTAIFQRALDFVEDRSSMNRSVERLAWNLSWESLANDPKADPLAVGYLQLSGQPSAYRGKDIRFTANVRGLQKIALPANHDLGLGAYYVLWMKPSDSGHTPYCVYSGTLPDSFEDPGNSFQTLDQKVDVSGRFFKLRSYEAANQKVEICPLIIARNISPIAKVRLAESEPWRPPRWLFLTFMICMPLVAFTMAYSVYHSTKARHRSYDGSKVNESLRSLTNNDTIKSDRENINDLYDTEL